MTRWLHRALLVVPFTLAGQDSPALIQAIGGHPDFSVESVVQYAEDDLSAVFGSELEAVLDFGIVAVSEIHVGHASGSASARLSEMVDSAAAFGLFAHGRDWRHSGYEPVVLGAEGYARTDRVVFWQSRFVVELAGSPAAALGLGRAISREITGPSRKPTVSTLLPAAGRVPESERYILTPSVLEEQTGLDPDVLGFENHVEVATATYQDGSTSASLALLSYPTPQLARLHSEAWLAASGSTAPSRRSGLLFGIVTSEDSGELADSILSELSSQFDVNFLPPPPDPLTIQEIILTAFTWIGIAMLLTLATGLGFGGLRIYLKTRYTSGIFGREPGPDFLQLNLDQPVKRKDLAD
jgi:hypothetical protein